MLVAGDRLSVWMTFNLIVDTFMYDFDLGMRGFCSIVLTKVSAWPLEVLLRNTTIE